MTRWRYAFLLLAGCSEPSTTLAPGSYDYAMSSPIGNYSGTLTITSATETEATGSWLVAGYDTEFIVSGWNIDAYLVGAKLSSAPRYLLNHRIDPDNLSCSGKAALITTGGVTSHAFTCTLTPR